MATDRDTKAGSRLRSRPGPGAERMDLKRNHLACPGASGKGYKTDAAHE